MSKKKAFTRFYSFLDKRQRVNFKNEALPILGISNSTFYYKTKKGNLLPGEALKIKKVLIKYGASEQELQSMGAIE